MFNEKLKIIKNTIINLTCNSTVGFCKIGLCLPVYIIYVYISVTCRKSSILSHSGGKSLKTEKREIVEFREREREGVSMGEREEAGGVDQVEEEFSVWRKNTPFLYDLIISHALEWPSLTVQWLPSLPSPDGDGTFAGHKLILGTHTADDVPNFLIVANVHLPCNPATAIETSLETPEIPKVCNSCLYIYIYTLDFHAHAIIRMLVI